MLLEICVASAEDAITAQTAGAQRVELNSAIELGGLTPSIGSVRETVENVSIPVIGMARPRPGGFCYSASDFVTMLRDVEAMMDAGVQGIAFGVLTECGALDIDRCRKLLELIGERDSVFHRAFDVCQDWQQTLAQLIDLGVTRVMTSGQQATALDGATVIREAIERAGDQIEILVAGGVRTANLGELVDKIGCRQVHAGLRCEKSDPSHPSGHPVKFYGSTPDSEIFTQTDPAAVRAMRDLLDTY